MKNRLQIAGIFFILIFFIAFFILSTNKSENQDISTRIVNNDYIDNFKTIVESEVRQLKSNLVSPQRKYVTWKGEIHLKDDYNVDKDTVLEILPGTIISVEKGKRITVNGYLIGVGNTLNKVTFKGHSNQRWLGIIVKGSQASLKKIILNNVVIKDIEPGPGVMEGVGISLYKGQFLLANVSILNLYKSLSILSDSSSGSVHRGLFSCNDAERFIYLKKSNVKITDSYFDGSDNGSVCPGADAIESVSSSVIIKNNYFMNIGDDGIKLKNRSEGYVVENYFSSITDEVIDISNSHAYVIANKFENIDSIILKSSYNSNFYSAKNFFSGCSSVTYELTNGSKFDVSGEKYESCQVNFLSRFDVKNFFRSQNKDSALLTRFLKLVDRVPKGRERVYDSLSGLKLTRFLTKIDETNREELKVLLENQRKKFNSNKISCDFCNQEIVIINDGYTMDLQKEYRNSLDSVLKKVGTVLK